MGRRKKEPQQDPNDILHGELLRWVSEAEDVTDESRVISEKCRDYYDSKQLSADETSQLKLRKQPIVVVNRVKPKMDALMGMEKAAKTTAKAYPRTPKHEGGAEAATEAIRFVLQDNAFDQVRSAAWENLLIEGTGGCEVVVGEQKNGELKIQINHIPWKRIIFDPHCLNKSFDPRTCRFMGQVVWMDYDEAAEKYPESIEILDSMISGSHTYDDIPRWITSRRRVKIVELYYAKGGDIWYACFTRGGFVKMPHVSPYKNEEGETEWPYEFASCFVDREGGRYGAVKQLLDVQDEINKRRSKALHLMSVRQVRWERGAVEDINAARQELAKPDGVIETTPGMEFEVLKTGDMAAAQFNLLSEAKMEIDAVGANAAVQGKDQHAQSGVALNERRMAGQTEIGPMFDVLRYWQYRVFRKVWNRIKQYWKAEKWIRVTDDEANLRWIGLNAPITKGDQLLEQAQAHGIPPPLLEQLKAKIAADPMMKEVVDTKNDIANLDVDIIISEVPDVLTAQIEDFKVLGEMVKSGFQMPPEAVIEASPLSNKDKILKMMKAQPQIPPQLQKQIEEQAEAVKQLTAENQQLKAGTQTDMAKMENQRAIKEQELSLEHERMKEEMLMKQQFEEWKAQLEAETKKIISGIDANAKKEIAKNDAENQASIEFNKMLYTAPEEDEDDETLNAHLEGEQMKKPIDRILESHGQVMQAHSDNQAMTQQGFQAISEALQQLITLQQQSLETQNRILAAQKAPKKVSVGGVQKGTDGRITGASVTVQ